MLSSKLFSKLPSFVRRIGSNFDREFVVNTDSRTIVPGEAFIALHGDSFDGFSYIEQVLKTGVRVAIFTSKDGRREQVEKLAALYPDAVFIETLDSLKFLQELASLHTINWKNNKLNRKLIGITGSNGKTTHKEMLFYILNTLFPDKVLATKGNLNNHIGVPLTLLRLEEKDEIAIIEMGMNHPGEIAELCSIAHPEHGIITNIGAAHIEFMHSMDNIFEEKKSLYSSVLKNTQGKGMFVVNVDDAFLSKIAYSEGLSTYGEKNGEIKVAIESHQISFNFQGRSLLVTNKNINEHHNLKNLAGTAILALKLFPEKEKEIILAASSYQQPSMNRSQWVDNIFLDAYNANPSSMKISIDSFVNVMKDKKIELKDCYFVLGDMNELGVFAEELHKEIAEHLNDHNIKNVTFIGRYKDYYKSGYAHSHGSYLKKEDFHEDWKKIRKNYKFIFVKASRSLQLETLLSIV